MAWSTPPGPWSPGELVTAADMNILSDDLSFLHGDAGIIELTNAIGRNTSNGAHLNANSEYFRFWGRGAIDGTSYTILPVGAITQWCLFYGAASNGTTQLGTTTTVYRLPGGTTVTFSDGGTNTLSVVFNANGSITVSRTAGSSVALSLLCWVMYR